MKKLSLLILAITIAASSFAQTSSVEITTVKKIKTDETVTSLKVYNNVEVFLTDDSTKGIQIVGEKAEAENIQVKISNGVLTITNPSGEFSKDKVAMFVPSKDLCQVFIHGSSIISSVNVISNEMLDVTINGNGKYQIKTTGSLNVNTIDDFPIELACI